MSKVNIVIALSCEAKPLIKHFRLQKLSQPHAFDIYTNKQQSIHLIISGVGKVKSAAATTYLHLLTCSLQHTIYLNIGVAGANQQAIGEMFAINKITDANSQHYFNSNDIHSVMNKLNKGDRVYYPATFMLPVMSRAALVTHTEPQLKINHESLVDMEAAGFFETASLYVSQEQVQVIKIVSDNQIQSVHEVTAKSVTQLIDEKLTEINAAVQALLKISSQEADYYESIDLTPYLERWHISVYQQYQLRELLRRWQVILKEVDPLSRLDKETCVAGVLSKLETELGQAVY